MNQLSIAILGGDYRQCYLAEYFMKTGHAVTCCHTLPFSYSHQPDLNDSLDEVLSDNTLIVGPVPFTRDQENLNCGSNAVISLYSIFKKLQPGHLLSGGNLPGFALAHCREKSIPAFDYMSSETLLLENAELTAEGMLCRILQDTPFALTGTPVLIWGLGRCGFALAKKLKTLGCPVTAADIHPDRIQLAQDCKISMLPSTFWKEAPVSEQAELFDRFPIMVNTVPHPVLTKERLELVGAPKNCILFDLASPPGGIDKTAAEHLGFKIYSCLGLPGKYSPKTAGELIGKIILDYYHNQKGFYYDN